MVDLRAVGAGDPLPDKPTADGFGGSREPGDVAGNKLAGGARHEEKPVSPPGDVADEAPEPLDVEAHPGPVAPGGDIVDRHLVGIQQFDPDGADGGLEAVAAGADPPQMRKRHRDADRPVAAHPEVARVVEEDHGGGRGAVDRFHEERSDERVGATRLEDHAATEVVVRRAEALEPIGEGSAAEIGTTVDDNARRLPLGV